MQTQSKLLVSVGVALLAGLFPHTFARARTPDVLGKVIGSSHATVGGAPLLSYGTVFSGDSISVGEGGTALLSFSPGGRAALAAMTTVRFSGSRGNVVAQVLSGTLVVEKEDKNAFVVKTPKYRVEPQGGERASLLVALSPDGGTIVEAQQGKATITRTSSGERYTLVEGFRAEIPASATGFPGQAEEQRSIIGSAVLSAAATQNGTPLPIGGLVFEGDLITTGAVGAAVIQLSPTTHVSLNQNTSARFTRIVERLWVRLQSGTIVAENTGRGYVVIATPRFQIDPASAEPSRIYVGVTAEDSTYIESATGDVRIKEIQSGQSYLLLAGQSTLVPANFPGVPGLQPLQATSAPPPPPSTAPTQSQPPSARRPNSRTALIVLAAGAGGGIAAAAASMSGGGDGGDRVAPPVSPSVP